MLIDCQCSVWLQPPPRLSSYKTLYYQCGAYNKYANCVSSSRQFSSSHAGRWGKGSRFNAIMPMTVVCKKININGLLFDHWIRCHSCSPPPVPAAQCWCVVYGKWERIKIDWYINRIYSSNAFSHILKSVLSLEKNLDLYEYKNNNFHFFFLSNIQTWLPSSAHL